MSVKVSGFRLIGEYELELDFTDGSSGRIDFRPWLLERGGLFDAFEEPRFFARVSLDADSGTLSWPNGVDLCPDVLHHRATGAPLPGGTPSEAQDQSAEGASLDGSA